MSNPFPEPFHLTPEQEKYLIEYTLARIGKFEGITQVHAEWDADEDGIKEDILYSFNPADQTIVVSLAAEWKIESIDVACGQCGGVVPPSFSRILQSTEGKFRTMAKDFCSYHCLSEWARREFDGEAS